MGKAVLHNLIDLIQEKDTETIYNVLIRFIPDTKPLDDEIEAINRANIDIANGDVMDLSAIDWNAI